GRREADEAEEPPLPARDLEQRQRDRLRPDLLVARHRARAVEADDHRAAAALVGAAERVREEAALDQAAREVVTQDGVVQRQQLGREEALEVAAEAHLEDLLAGALEGAPAERERLLAHAADDGGELAELRVGGEPPAELDLPPRRGAAAGAEASAPAPGLLPRLLELAREAGEGLEERAVERRGRRDRLRRPEARLELEEEAEHVLEERAEVGHERAAVLGHPGEGGRVGDQRRERAPVVGVALDPAVLV